MRESLYNYIKNHIDDDGVFTEPALPDLDEAYSVIQLGQSDAFFYTADMPSDVEDASAIVTALREYLAEPVQEKRQSLYRLLKNKTLAEYCDPFISTFDSDDMNEVALDLARRFLYNARHREPLKFALLLFGLYGMERIEREEPELWQDLLLVAHCEEFTFAFLYACRSGNYICQKAVWELLGCTKGWGKVFCIIDCQCPDDEHRLWLLKNGPDIEVEYPPLAVKLITATHLGAFLERPVLDYECYKNTIAIVGNYMQLLLHYQPAAVRENYNLADIDLYKLLKAILHHALYLCVEPEDMLDMLTLATLLCQLQEEGAYYSLSPNQIHELIASCDRLVYSTNWEPLIKERVIDEGQINYRLADFAYELELDIWPMLYDFWLEHPEEYTLLPYLLAYEGERRSVLVLEQLTLRLNLYRADMHSLIVPLHYLRNNPGKGEAIVCAALESIFELVRSCACDVLEAWDREYFSPAIMESIVKGMHMCTDELLTLRLRALYVNERFDMEGFIQKLKKQQREDSK